jgi:tetratricopeptide (TPR) repeat protein
MALKYFTLTIIIFFSVTRCMSQTACDSTAFYQAVGFHQNGNFDSAILKYSQQIETCPSFCEAYINRGFCFCNLLDRKKANQDFSAAVSVSPDKAKTLYSIADIFFNAKDYDTAFVMFSQAAKFDSTNSTVYFKMGRCEWLARVKIMVANHVEDYATDTAFKSHLVKEILTYYDRAIYLDSTEHWQLYTARGTNSLDAMQDMNTNYEYYYFRGLFKSNFADYAGALADYEKSLLIHPTINAYEYAAYLARKVGQNQKACDYIQMWAMLMNPSEDLRVDKHAVADKFCTDLGVKKK